MCNIYIIYNKINITSHRNISRCIVDLNIKGKIIDEYLGCSLLGLKQGIKNINHQEIFDKLDYIKIKNFCSSRNTTKKEKASHRITDDNFNTY